MGISRSRSRAAWRNRVAEGTFTLNFNPNPTQRQFICSQARADFFSTRVGEGKSTALTWSLYYHMKHNPGVRCAMIRDTWENLRRTTLASFFEWFPPGIFGTWSETNKEFTWAEGLGKGKILWLGMDDPKDAAKLQSLELGFIGMDEVSPAEGSGGIPELVFDLALTRLRQAGMQWYGCKLASNNSDDTHWSYRRFVEPGTDGFVLWQPALAENSHNLPANYYQLLREQLGHRQDLVSRFIEGQFGFQQIGTAVTPQFSEKLHAATGLAPIRGQELVLCWDFGLNPTCIITQPTPVGHWNILKSFVGDGIGVQELIEEVVKPYLASRMPLGTRWRHIGDPNGVMREQSSSRTSAVAVIRAELGGAFRGGPVSFLDRTEPLRAVLAKTVGGRGLLQVDRNEAREVFLALRGGWHFKETNGVLSQAPVKDIHSHPGDALSYGAARLFPMGRLQRPARIKDAPTATFFGGQQTASKIRVPPEMREIMEGQS